MIDVQLVENFFLRKGAALPDGEGVCNMKLQKLLYYAQGYCLALTKAPLFAEPVEAWRHGPVVNDSYQRFKAAGQNPIQVDEGDLASADELSFEITEILEGVWDQYGRYTPSYLRELTHNEAPWLTARAGLKPEQNSQRPLNHELMRRTFVAEYVRLTKARRAALPEPEPVVPNPEMVQAYEAEHGAGSYDADLKLAVVSANEVRAAMLGAA